MGLAPTTSTTMMLGLGDALAVALLEARGFSSSEFHALHPGGRLGARLLRVADIMHPRPAVPVVAPGSRMDQVLIAMTGGSFGCALVADGEDRLAGIVTDGDLRRHMAPNLPELAVEQVMSRRPRSVMPSTLAAEALAVMNRRAITALPVVDDQGRLAGIVHIHDCLRAGIA